MTTSHIYWNLLDPRKSGEYPEGIAVYGTQREAQACAIRWRETGLYRSVRVYQRPVRVAGMQLPVYCVVRTFVNTHKASEVLHHGA